MQKPAVLVVGAEPHDSFDAGAVVPAAVEQHDLAGRRQMLDVALEVPLVRSRSVGAGSADDTCDARVQVLR